MEKKKCSLKKHSEIDAINYCHDCNKYLCNKCQNLHSELFDDHHLYSIDKYNKDFFTGFCQEEHHNQFKLEFFCKSHNKLCCIGCSIKSEKKEYGQHKDCDVCIIEKIKDEKKIN